jgi:SRSO17 transposase
MIEEMTGPGGWGVLDELTAAGGTRPVAVADAGYGDYTTFRLELDKRGWCYVLAVKATTSAYPYDAVPAAMSYRGRGRPSVPRYRIAPASLRQLALAYVGQTQQVTWRRGTLRTADRASSHLGACPCAQPLALDRLSAALART